MEIALLMQSAMGLLVVLGALVLFLIVLPKSKPKEVKKSKKVVVQKKKVETKKDINHLRDIIKNRKSTTEELQEAVELVMKYHGTIHKKLGLRPHPESQVYMDIVFNICRHPNTNKDIIIKFDKELEKLNPDYKKEINDAMTRGLNSRGF